MRYVCIYSVILSALDFYQQQFGMTVSDLLNLDAVNAVSNSAELNQVSS